MQNSENRIFLNKAYEEIIKARKPAGGLLQSIVDGIYKKEEYEDIANSIIKRTEHNLNVIQENFDMYHPYFSKGFCEEIENALEKVRLTYNSDRIAENENDKKKIPYTTSAYINALVDLETLYIKKMEEEIRMSMNN